jgi:hypothetical protein
MEKILLLNLRVLEPIGKDIFKDKVRKDVIINIGHITSIERDITFPRNRCTIYCSNKEYRVDESFDNLEKLFNKYKIFEMIG